ncbi:MAG: hypothetical protein FWH01_16900 [Oscillospiraceae bacterium]|nr:hypothetical protein [Oscillospiraceae bacterium]
MPSKSIPSICASLLLAAHMLAGCSAPVTAVIPAPAPAPAPASGHTLAQAPAPAPASALPDAPGSLSDWYAALDLDAQDTPQTLYAAAQNEDMLVVYSTSTRMMDVAKSFERNYPGLLAYVEHIREGELFDKLNLNYESGDFACDVICSADGKGILENEFLPKLIAVKYTPYDIKSKILPGNDDAKLMLAGEATVFSYNAQYYQSPPVGNWWELTEEKWRGMIYIPNPSRSVTTSAFFNMLISNSDEMALAYEALYGRPLETGAGESAGREYIRRLMANDAVIVNSSDEIAEIIGAPGSRSPSIGIVISSKTRLRDIGYEMANHYGMEPFCGVYLPNCIMLAGGARNINAAKLFIRWVLGEADGQGEGYRPYLLSGAWSVRSDVRDETGVRIDELNLLHPDSAYLYANQDTFLTFWEELLLSRD